MNTKRPRLPRTPRDEQREQACGTFLLAMCRLHTSMVVAEALGISKGGLLSFLVGESRPATAAYIIAQTEALFPDGTDVRDVPAPMPTRAHG